METRKTTGRLLCSLVSKQDLCATSGRKMEDNRQVALFPEFHNEKDNYIVALFLIVANMLTWKTTIWLLCSWSSRIRKTTEKLLSFSYYLNFWLGRQLKSCSVPGSANEKENCKVALFLICCKFFWQDNWKVALFPGFWNSTMGKTTEKLLCFSLSQKCATFERK